MVWEPGLWPSRPWAQQAGGALLAHGRSSGAGGRGRRPRFRERRGARGAGCADGGREGLREPGATPHPPPARLQGPATSTAGPLTHRSPGPGGRAGSARRAHREPRPAPPALPGALGSSGDPLGGPRGGTRPGERPGGGLLGRSPGLRLGGPGEPQGRGPAPGGVRASLELSEVLGCTADGASEKSARQRPWEGKSKDPACRARKAVGRALGRNDARWLGPLLRQVHKPCDQLRELSA